MRYKLLGNSGLRVSEAALGTMTFGTDWGWGAEEGESRRIFDAYAEAGGNFIDTANNYTAGTSERFVGEFVRPDREHFVLATKYTLNTRPGDPNACGNHRKNLVQSVEASLRRLGIAYIDLLWVHIWDPMTPVHETVRALDDMVRSGKVLYVGISDAPAWVVTRANTLAEERGWSPFVAYQGQYSLVERGVERDVLPMARALDLAFCAWGLLGSGVLTGKYNAAGDGPRGRVDVAGMEGVLTERNLGIASEVVAVANELGATPSQVAIAWVRDQPGVVIPILGSSSLRQFADNMAAIDLSLPTDQRARLDRVSAIDLGFPHDFLIQARQFTYAGIDALIDDHRKQP